MFCRGLNIDSLDIKLSHIPLNFSRIFLCDILVTIVGLTKDFRILCLPICLNKLLGSIVIFKVYRLEVFSIQRLVLCFCTTLGFYKQGGTEVISFGKAHTVMYSTDKNLGTILVCACIKFHINPSSIKYYYTIKHNKSKGINYFFLLDNSNSKSISFVPPSYARAYPSAIIWLFNEVS